WTTIPSVGRSCRAGFTASKAEAQALGILRTGMVSRGSPHWRWPVVPWPPRIRGHVNNAFHPDHGYRGAMPRRGEKAEPAKRADRAHFAGNEERDGRGHATEAKRSFTSSDCASTLGWGSTAGACPPVRCAVGFHGAASHRFRVGRAAAVAVAAAGKWRGRRPSGHGLH